MPLSGVPRIGVSTAEFAEGVRDAGGEPVKVELPEARPAGGVALVREWLADFAEASCATKNLDVLLADPKEPEELFGLLLAALRLDLPAVVHQRDNIYTLALAALGAAPVEESAVELAVEKAGGLETLRGELIGSFSLANALRAGLSVGGGPELLVHLSALAREGEISGFSQMLRVLTPETPAFTEPGSAWLKENSVAGLLAALGEDLHDVPTITGWLKEPLPEKVPPPDAASRLIFVEGKASGTEAVCRVPVDTKEISGECRVFFSEKAAAAAFRAGNVEPGSILVVGGCGPRGSRGLKRMTELKEAVESAGPAEDLVVFTDGLAPDCVTGSWVSLLTPEAAKGGVISRLQDGDWLRLDLEKGLIKAGVSAKELGRRKAYEDVRPPKTGYTARYARTVRRALDGAGFG